MKNFLRAKQPSFFYLCLSFILLISVGCIEIGEYLTVNEDYTGSYSLILNTEMLPSIFLMSGTDLSKELPGFYSEMKMLKNKIAGVKGISNFQLDTSITDGKISFGFDFDGEESLNLAMYALVDVRKRWYSPNIYSISEGKVKRKNIAPFLRKFVKKNYPGLFDFEVLKKISLYSENHVPGAVIKTRGEVFHQRGNQSGFRWEVHGLLNGSQSLGYKIKFDPGK